MKHEEETTCLAGSSGATVGNGMTETNTQKSLDTVGAETIRHLWPEFVALVRSRLDAGAKEYGDESFELRADSVMAEIEQEVLDIMGWGFILFARMQRLKAKLAKIENAQA